MRTERASKYSFSAFPGFILGLALGLMLCQCSPSQTRDKPRVSGTSPLTVQHNGYKMPRFATADEQLRYARSWFANAREKQAALEVVLEHFGEPADIRARAELELAYLDLGPDYRVAGEADCDRAIARYQRIIRDYARLPVVCANAYWHLGWIYADLLGRKEQGLAFFRTVAARYGDALMRIEPPVPWVSLVMPQAEDKSPEVYTRPAYSWGNMALLEILRHARDRNERRKALERLLSDQRDNLVSVYALRLVLQQRGPLAREAAGHACRLLESKTVSQSLGLDLRKAIARLPLDTGRPVPVSPGLAP